MRDPHIPTLLKKLQSPNVTQYDEHWLIEETLQDIKRDWLERPQHEMLRQLLSTQNYILRSQYSTHPELRITAGDICFIDFGHAYQHEAGYQHFGIVLPVVNGKVFVIPMTSNDDAFTHAYDEKTNPSGKKHLFRFKQCCGLNRDSVLFLNDCKFINSSRIIEVKGHLEQESKLFTEIKLRVFECLFKSV